MTRLSFLPDLAEHNGPLAFEVMSRASGKCEVGARGCDRHGRRYLLVGGDSALTAQNLLYVCRPCTASCMKDPGLAHRLAGQAEPAS